MSIGSLVNSAIERQRARRELREQAVEEWSRRKERILSDPIGRSLWMALARHRLTLSSRNPVYGWQVERTYVRFIEDVLPALDEERER